MSELMSTLRQGNKVFTVADADARAQAEKNKTDIASLTQEVDNLKGDGSGTSGENGGHYTPSVTQPNTSTMRVEFTPSKDGMPNVPAADITLPQGPKGDKGDSGHTPERGVDYWTEADQESMVQQVIAALPDASEVSY